MALANPNQPIESIYSLSELKKIAEKCQKCNSLFVVDEAYYHFSEITALPLIRDFDNIVSAGA